MRSACWVPAVTTMLAGSASRPRVAARCAAICARSSGSPCGGGYPVRSLDSDFSTRAAQRAQASLGNRSGAGMPPAEQRAEARVARRGRGGDGGEALAALRQRIGGGRRRDGRVRRGIGQVGGDIGAAAGAGAHIALGREALVGQHHGLARHAQFLGQRAGGRQTGAGRQRAGKDALAQPVEHRLLAVLVWCEHRGSPRITGPIGP